MLVDNFNNLNRSTRNATFGALIIITAIAMYSWIFNPHITHLFAAQEYESIVSKAEEKNKVVAREVETKTNKLEKLNEQLEKVQSILSTPDEAKNFFSNLQNVSEEAGCTVNSLNLVVKEPSLGKKKKQKQSEYSSSIVANSAMLTVSGQYHDIIRLLEKLQSSTKKVWMDSFNIGTIASDSDLLKCDMTITVYTVEEEPAE